MPIKHLSKEQLLSIHSEILSKFGKEKGAVDDGNLESALYRVAGYVAKNEKETIFWKAAILAERIILGHPFIDGNKRTAFAATKVFLELNGFNLETGEQDAIDFLLAVAKNRKNRYSIKRWLEGNSKAL